MDDVELKDLWAKMKKTTDWTDEELSAAVVAYLRMLGWELGGLPFVKSEVTEELRAGALSSRTKASIEFRMQNISAILYDMRVPHIFGYLPAKNVGNRVKERIKTLLVAKGIADFYAYVPTADVILLEQKVAQLRSKLLGRTPPGKMTPTQITISSTSFVRDPAVKRWILHIADGFCEGCSLPAPFLGCDGFPYLEVHHITPLASHGSDRISNALALCPNCHRRCHYAADRDEFKLYLFEKIQRLKIEALTVEDVEFGTLIIS